MSPVRLQVTVMIAAFVVATISSTAATSPVSRIPTPFPHETTSTPSPPPPSFSSECRRDGEVVEGLEPGGFVQNGCEFCECFDGQVFCSELDCVPTMCWDYLPTECCRICPNGNNCKTPSGTIINEGQTVTENGVTCTCTMDNVWDSWYGVYVSKHGPYAQCSSTTTAPPPTTTSPPTTTPQINTQSPAIPCLHSNGSLVEGLQPGSSVEIGCIYYTCSLDGMVYMIYNDCGLAPILCADSVQGECCRTCPNGQNCRTPSGKIIKDGETVTENGVNCTCSLDHWWDNWDWDRDPLAGPQAQCGSATVTPPLPTTPPPPTTPKRRSPEERERWRKIRKLKRKLRKFRHTLPIKEKRKLKRRLRRLQSQG